MADEMDVYRSAKLIIDQHGDDAEIHAAMMADEMHQKGDTIGYTMWKLIIKAIREIQNGQVPPEASIH